MNADGLPDLLTGHELCEELYFLENEGTKTSAKFNAFSNRFPNNQNPANSSLFPAPYWVDVDNDGIKDLFGFQKSILQPAQPGQLSKICLLL
jgi:hypothetical protein